MIEFFGAFVALALISVLSSSSDDIEYQVLLLLALLCAGCAFLV